MPTDTVADRRMNRIDTIQENCPSLCWAHICMWAMFRHDTVTLDGAEECKQESADVGSCYCGRFKNGVDTRFEVNDA